MSKAFTKEDVDPPERSGRVRSASGLPPGATNYITPGGAARLRKALAELRGGGNEEERIAEIEQTLASVTVVEPPLEPEQGISFGARVSVRDATGETRSYRIVGVDELDFEPDAVSWISPVGRTLLAAELGDRVVLEDATTAKILKIEYPTAYTE